MINTCIWMKFVENLIIVSLCLIKNCSLDVFEHFVANHIYHSNLLSVDTSNHIPHDLCMDIIITR